MTRYLLALVMMMQAAPSPPTGFISIYLDSDDYCYRLVKSSGITSHLRLDDGSLWCDPPQTTKPPEFTFDIEPEPEDVPAIQVTEMVTSCDVAINPGGCLHEYQEKQTRTTCADRTRILQHDEQDPPVYWCHKVNQ